MHMANELLSVPVATATLGIAAAGLSLVCRKAKHVIGSDKMALMGVLGAFVFAAQMVNFQLPLMPGTSGHMVGAVLLAIILGPHAGAIVISSVVIVQCLIFQDGGLLALGCNIINMALVPSYIGYFIYRFITKTEPTSLRVCVGTMLACTIAIEVGAVLVPIQAGLSGILVVPLQTFMITMLGIHLLVGLIEGVITVAVLGYLQQVRPDLALNSLPGKIRLSRKAVIVTLIAMTFIVGAGVSLLACGFPDGLEWSYAERPDQPDFEPIVSNQDSRVAAVDKLQSKYSVLPDYSIRSSQSGEAREQSISAGWTSFAAVVGSVATMILVWLVAAFFSKPRLAG